MKFKALVILVIFCASSNAQMNFTIPIASTTTISTTSGSTTSTRFPLPPTPTTTITTTTTLPPPPPGPCDNIQNGQVVDPSDCTRYFTCLDYEISISHTCPPNQIFSGGSCVAGDPETCVVSTETTTPQPPPTTTPTTPVSSTTTNTNTPPSPTEEPINPCENIENGLVADQWNCTTYYQCENYTVVLNRSCLPGQIFWYGRCQPGDISQCWGGESTTTDVPKNPCVDVGTGNAPIEANCTHYLVCDGGEIVGQNQCEEGYIFIENECIVGEALTCLPDIDTICKNVFFGARYHPGDRKIFVGCIRRKGSPFECDSTEYFDRTINECIDEVTKKRRTFEEILKGF